MAPEISFDNQRPAEYMFEKQVEELMQDVETSKEASKKRRKVKLGEKKVA
jgi:hypothetical protein